MKEVSSIVIQENMTLKAIVNAWLHTKEVFDQYYVSINDRHLQELLDEEALIVILKVLNHAVGSSTDT